MNEKIKELRQQATIIVGAESGFAFDREVLDEQKFAELIIRECMGHAEEIGRLNHGRGSWDAVYDRIRIKMLSEEL